MSLLLVNKRTTPANWTSSQWPNLFMFGAFAIAMALISVTVECDNNVVNIKLVERHCKSQLKKFEALSEFERFAHALAQLQQNPTTDQQLDNKHIERCIGELDSIVLMASIVEQARKGDACDPRLIDRLEAFDDVYVRDSLPLMQKLELAAKAHDSAMGRRSQLARPSVEQQQYAKKKGFMVSFVFQQVALQVSQLCRSQILDNIEQTVEPQFQMDPDVEFLLAGGSSVGSSNKQHQQQEIGELFRVENIEDLILGEHRVYYQLHESLLSKNSNGNEEEEEEEERRQLANEIGDYNREAENARYDENMKKITRLGDDLHVSKKVQSALNRTRSICQHLEPYYDPLIVSVVRLAKRGYYADARSFERRLASSKHEAILVSKWLTIVQTCDIVLRIQLAPGYSQNGHRLTLLVAEDGATDKEAKVDQSQSPVAMDNQLADNLYAQLSSNQDSNNPVAFVTRAVGKFVQKIIRLWTVLRSLWQGKIGLNIQVTQEAQAQHGDHATLQKAEDLLDELDERLERESGDMRSARPRRRSSGAQRSFLQSLVFRVNAIPVKWVVHVFAFAFAVYFLSTFISTISG